MLLQYAVKNHHVCTSMAKATLTQFLEKFEPANDIVVWEVRFL